jgi:hypothetical protein
MLLLLLLCAHLLHKAAVVVLVAARSLPLGLKYVRLEGARLLGRHGFCYVADPEQL